VPTSTRARPPSPSGSSIYTGKNYKIGEVHEGTATMDFLQEEQERGITIQSAATTCPWEVNGVEYKINLIDTPGHVDFTVEVERASACSTEQSRSSTARRASRPSRRRSGVRPTGTACPRLCFINKMDKLGADFEFSFKSIIEASRQQPDRGPDPDRKWSTSLEGIVDLILMKAYYFDANELDGRQVIEIGDIPDELRS
jgi:elongation factor G